MKKRKIISFIILFVIFITIASVVSELGKEVEVIFDASKYSQVSSEQLVEALGEPRKIIDDAYVYDEMEFTVKNNVVIKFKYLPNSSVKYNFENDIFKMFGITPNKDTMRKTVDNNLTLKFEDVTDEVWEFEVYGINEKDKTFDIIYISYQ